MEVSGREGGHVKAEAGCRAWSSINSLFCPSGPNWTLGLALKSRSQRWREGAQDLLRRAGGHPCTWPLCSVPPLCVRPKAT